jgi:hypothetical protein
MGVRVARLVWTNWQSKIVFPKINVNPWQSVMEAAVEAEGAEGFAGSVWGIPEAGCSGPQSSIVPAGDGVVKACFSLECFRVKHYP